MPSGHGLSGGSLETVERLESLLCGMGGEAVRGLRAGLGVISISTVVRHRRRFENLSLDARKSVLRRYSESSSRHVRWGLRIVLTLLKTAHFDDPRMADHVGCASCVDTPKRIERAPYMQQVTDGREIDEDVELECEVVVVGTGAGGAAIAYELARRGRAVLMLEAGSYHRRDAFDGNPAKAYAERYLAGGATFAIGNVASPVWAGRGVGGSTTINSGTCYRAPERTLSRWRDRYGLSMISSETLAPYYERVESMLEVTPAREDLLNGSARMIARGAAALGLDHGPLRRNAPHCDGQGVCCFGCPTGAKRSTDVSYVPSALRRGAQLITGAAVERVVVEGHRATGVEARLGSGARLRVRAQSVVVAGGALMTPLLLRRSGVLAKSRYLGKNLSIHPATRVLALFDERIDMSRGIPQGYSISSLEGEGILFEGASMPLNAAASAIPWVGDDFMALMASYPHLASFGLMVQDTSRGEVREGPRGTPIIRYDLGRDDLERMHEGIALLAEVFLEAGARRVLPFVHDSPPIESYADVGRLRMRRLRPGDFDVAAFHPLGTCRMGIDPARSCVGPDNETHDTESLYVADGSVVPSSLGVNPQLTIMAMSLRAAETIDARLDRPRPMHRRKAEPKLGFRFAETMSGVWTAHADGITRPLSFTIRARSEALERFARRREARVEGTIDADGLATGRDVVGTLGMDLVVTGRLTYELSFTGDDGARYRFSGHKSFSALSPLHSLTHLPGRLLDDGGKEIGGASVDFDVGADLVGFLRSFELTEVEA